ILEPKYIEKLLEKFEEDSSLGIAGGSLKIIKNNNISNYIDESKVVFGCNRIYSRKCWYELNAGKILNVNSVAWDSEHSQKALNRGYKVVRFPEINSYAQRVPTLRVPFFLAGKLRYQFGYSLSRSMISGIVNCNPKFIVGYLSAWFNDEKKIDESQYIKKMRKEYDKGYLKKICSKILKDN
ncbi:MAG: hypothetical protein KGH95_01645, partial [Thaumarchaeota archaeon]|nr:hypothetical protein [Nitrososphaerota archaeon]